MQVLVPSRDRPGSAQWMNAAQAIRDQPVLPIHLRKVKKRNPNSDREHIDSFGGSDNMHLHADSDGAGQDHQAPAHVHLSLSESNSVERSSPHDRDAEIARLHRENAQLRAVIQEKEQQIQELQRALNESNLKQSSQGTSSQPASHEHAHD